MGPLDRIDYSHFHLAEDFFREKIKWSGRQVNVNTGKERVITWEVPSSGQVLETKELKESPTGLGIVERPSILGVNRSVDSGWREKIESINKCFDTHIQENLAFLQGKSSKEKNLFLGNMINLNRRLAKSLGRHELSVQSLKKENPALLLALRETLQMGKASDEEVVDCALALLKNQGEIINGRDWRDVVNLLNQHLPIEKRVSFVDIQRINLMMNPLPDISALYDLPEVREKFTFIQVPVDLVNRKLNFAKEAIVFDSAYNELVVIPRSQLKEYVQESGSDVQKMRTQVIQKLCSFISDRASFEETLSSFEPVTYEEMGERILNLLNNLTSLVKEQKTPLGFPKNYVFSAHNNVSAALGTLLYDKTTNGSDVEIDKLDAIEHQIRDVFIEFLGAAEKNHLFVQ